MSVSHVGLGFWGGSCLRRNWNGAGADLVQQNSKDGGVLHRVKVEVNHQVPWGCKRNCQSGEAQTWVKVTIGGTLPRTRKCPGDRQL